MICFSAVPETFWDNLQIAARSRDFMSPELFSGSRFLVQTGKEHSVEMDGREYQQDQGFEILATEVTFLCWTITISKWTRFTKFDWSKVVSKASETLSDVEASTVLRYLATVCWIIPHEHDRDHAFRDFGLVFSRKNFKVFSDGVPKLSLERTDIGWKKDYFRC